MKPLWMLLMIVGTATAAQGPAGSGACAHVIGPVGIDGRPLGFTCQDVGGNALLIWNAAQVDSNVDVSGGISTVNYRSGGLTINESFSSDGPMAFVGGNLTINGSVMATRIIIAGTSTSEDEVKSGLLGASGRLGGSQQLKSPSRAMEGYPRLTATLSLAAVHSQIAEV